MTLEADLQQGWHDAIVELIDLDLSPITHDSADIFYFTNVINQLLKSLILLKYFCVNSF